MGGSLIQFGIAEAKWSIVFPAATLDVFAANRQLRRWSQEAVGQLFSADLTTRVIQIDKATVLRPTRSSFNKVSFDPELAFAERANFFSRGLYCVGLWHSHPECRPSPSPQDVLLAQNHADAAARQLNGFVFVIVGQDLAPGGLFVGIHDRKNLIPLAPLAPMPG